MRRTIRVILACLLVMMILSGCRSGAHEIDDLTYVLMIGIDRGVSDKLRFTFYIPTYSGSPQGGGSQSGARSGSDAEAMQSVTIDAATFFSAQTLFSASLSRMINFSHAKYIVISEELARDTVEPFMNGMIRSYQLRRSMYILISKGPAADFIRNYKPAFGASVSKTQELMMLNGDRTEFFKISTYNEFLNAMKSSSLQASATLVAINDFSKFRESGVSEKDFKSNGQYVAGDMPRTGGNKYEFCGTAIFDGTKMIGELNADETRAMQLLEGTFHTSQIVIPDPENPDLRVGVEIWQMKKPDITITFRDRNPVISARVFLEGVLQNVQSTTEYEWDKKAEFEKAVETFVKDMLERTVNKCKALNCDVFSFGDVAVRQFLTIQAWEEYTWISHFKDAQVSTEVDFILGRTGTMTKTEGSHSG